MLAAIFWVCQQAFAEDLLFWVNARLLCPAPPQYLFKEFKTKERTIFFENILDSRLKCLKLNIYVLFHVYSEKKKKRKLVCNQNKHHFRLPPSPSFADADRLKCSCSLYIFAFTSHWRVIFIEKTCFIRLLFSTIDLFSFLSLLIYSPFWLPETTLWQRLKK